MLEAVKKQSFCHLSNCGLMNKAEFINRMSIMNTCEYTTSMPSRLMIKPLYRFYDWWVHTILGVSRGLVSGVRGPYDTLGN